MRTMTVGDLQNALGVWLLQGDIHTDTPVLIGGVGSAWLLNAWVERDPAKIGYVDDRRVADCNCAVVLAREV